MPVAPTGGPQDNQPPRVQSTVPSNGDVNVSISVIRITFDEYISEPSFGQALSINPEPGVRPDIRWKGKTVEVRLREALEPNTTYILTIDTKLRDNHGVSLSAPITQAFSTGPEINRGTLRGKVVEPLRGGGKAGIQVFAYPLPAGGELDSLPPKPLYRTETDTRGEFRFEYLSPRPYFVLAVEDRNGNRQPDNLETIALPPIGAIVADSSSQPIEHLWITTVLDTIPPEIRRVESLSARRIAVRYSEAVVAPPDTSLWSLTDSLHDQRIAVENVFQLPDDLRRVFLQTSRLTPGAYSLQPGVASDSTGNAAPRDEVTFHIASVGEQGIPRFLEFIPTSAEASSRLRPHSRPGVLYDGPISEEEARKRISVADTTGAELDFKTTSADGVRHFLSVDLPREGQPFVVRVKEDSLAVADSSVERLFSYLTTRDLGGIVGSIFSAPLDTSLYVDALPSATGILAGTALVNSSGDFSIPLLEVGGYTLRIRRDDNDNGRWDAGRIRPFLPAEPLFWKTDSLRVRARWDTDVDTLRIPYLMGDRQ